MNEFIIGNARGRRLIVYFAAVFFLVTVCFVSSSKAQSQSAVVANFYKTILTFKDGGVPSPKNIERLSSYISREFHDLLLKAHEAGETYAKKTKGEEPPLVEGSLFYSLFEGADKYTTITKEQEKNRVSFLVKLEYTDPYGKHEKVHWHDRTILIKENKRWVVHDVELLGEWQFGAKGKLSDILRGVIKDAAEATPE